MRRARVWVGAGLLLGSCEAAEPRVSPRPSPGKLELFGDASLVPTREGERARRELAIAGELERALLALGFATVHVGVELREPTTVLIIARRAEVGASEDPIAAVVAAIVEVDPADLRVLVLPPIAEAPAPERRLDAWTIALLLGALGLGLSLGVLGERLRTRA